MASVSHYPSSDEIFLPAPHSSPDGLKMKVFVVLLSLAVAASARMAYQFSDGYLDILGAEPVHSFDCTDRPYGYYADVATNCQVFHVCVPIPDETGHLVETHQYSFFCNNKTIFNQESLTCDHEDYAFPCSEAETLFGLSNADFGRIPEGGFDGEPIIFPEIPLGRRNINVNTVAEPAEPAEPVEPAEPAEPAEPVESSSGSGRAIKVHPEETSVNITPEETPESKPEVEVHVDTELDAKPEEPEVEVHVNTELDAKPEEPEVEVHVDNELEAKPEEKPESEVRLAIPSSVPTATLGGDEEGGTTVSILEEEAEEEEEVSAVTEHTAE